MAVAVQTPSPVPTFESPAFCSPTPSPRQSSDEPPTSSLIDQCAQYPVFDADGTSQSFESLYKDSRCMVIFVRHFFCGICQDYIRNLVARVSPKSLASAARPTRIVIIGCGQPELIADYALRTDCPFPIYADPSRRLYDDFGMKCSLNKGGRRPDYQSTTFTTMAIKSFVQSLVSGSPLKGGSFSQMGGEFLFENNRVAWCYKMKNTRDHTEVNDLMEVLEL